MIKKISLCALDIISLLKNEAVKTAALWLIEQKYIYDQWVVSVLSIAQSRCFCVICITNTEKGCYIFKIHIPMLHKHLAISSLKMKCNIELHKICTF